MAESSMKETHRRLPGVRVCVTLLAYTDKNGDKKEERRQTQGNIYIYKGQVNQS